MHFQPGGTVPRPAQSPIHSVSEARVHGFVVSPQPKNLGQRPAGWTASRPDTACYVCPRYVLPLSPARAGIPLNLAVPAAHRRASPSAASPPPPTPLPPPVSLLQGPSPSASPHTNTWFLCSAAGKIPPFLASCGALGENWLFPRLQPPHCSARTMPIHGLIVLNDCLFQRQSRRRRSPTS